MRIVALAVLNFQSKYLLCLRKMGLNPYTWEFPSSELEEGDTLEDALERHLFLELGVRSYFNKIICRTSMVINGEEILFYALSGRILGGKLGLLHYADVCFVKSNQLYFYNMARYTARILYKIT